MGYALTGYPSRSDKRRRQSQYRFCAYEDDRRRPKGKARARRKGTVEANGRVAQMKTPPSSLQELPVEVLERIFVLSRDLTLMPALNSYFYHNLKPSSHLLRKFMWEIYSFDYYDYEASVLRGKLSNFNENEVFLIDSIFDNRTFFEFYRDNYAELSKRVRGYIPRYCLEADFSMSHPDVPGYDFPERFYTEFDHLFLHKEMMNDLGNTFTFERVSEVIEGLLEWLFTEFPPYVKNYDQIHEAIVLVLDLGFPDYVDAPAGPLFALLHAVFENKDPQGLRAFADRLCEEEVEDSRIKLLESFLTRWYAEGESRDCLSDPMLWAELRRLSNMAVVEAIERCGGEPQYDIFF
ncbi:hypothetical protein HG536_0H01570 [Torulaspora globosa]|uniref:F-box domain-containing protein n=1 Tax=Torulaspora globosa TaxID=48254 RepID=A0A7G3ZMP6_9SACH|nr:uncharacterized protein HG536_0H01570 [Torulaspora globosa]QLL34782.1 hypothetical protein HG536_0H01570 [Torulaspora globosa]